MRKADSMTRSGSDSGLLARALGAVGGGLLRAVLAIAGLVFVASAVVAALIASVAVGVWALLSGRRPAVLAVVRRGWRLRRTRRGRGHPDPRGEVVDVEAREVDEPADGGGRLGPPRR
jgi:hypothetical protein